MIATPFGDKYQGLEKLQTSDGLETYRARSAEGAVVEIKVVTPRDTTSFLAQARTAAKVIHPNVTRVLESAELEGRCFVVYEGVGGVDLSAALSFEGRLLPATVTETGMQIADGLAAIHALGLVHGRIRPETVARTADGRVKILDLGLTEALLPVDLTTAAPASAAHYISPEEVLARPLVPASDLYELGVVLYELATGRLPIDGANAFEVAEHHVEEFVEPLGSVDREIPPELDSVVLKALAKAPQDRYASAEAMRRDLEHIISGKPIVAPPPMPVPMPAPPTESTKRSVWGWVAAAVAIVAIAVLAAVLLSGSGVKVPNVVGLSVSDATTAIDKVGLKVGTVTFEPTTGGTVQGTVIKQLPKAGSEADKESAVNLVVAGSAMVSVPDVTGMTQAAATAALADAGLTLAEVKQAANATIAAGTVITQSPSAGTEAPQGSPVTITVSTGPAPSAKPSAGAVPDVTGLTQAEAVSTLNAAGYTAVVAQHASATVPAGTVTSQTPSAGVIVAAGTTITITVSTGPEATPTATPSPSAT